MDWEKWTKILIGVAAACSAIESISNVVVNAQKFQLANESAKRTRSKGKSIVASKA